MHVHRFPKGIRLCAPWHADVQIGIAGRTLQSNKSMYCSSISCVNIGQKLTGWFPVSSGVRQGDSLIPTWFAIFINELAVEIEEANKGILIDEAYHLPMLYADDFSVSESSLMFLIMNTWGASSMNSSIMIKQLNPSPSRLVGHLGELMLTEQHCSLSRPRSQ